MVVIPKKVAIAVVRWVMARTIQPSDRLLVASSTSVWTGACPVMLYFSLVDSMIYACAERCPWTEASPMPII